MTKTCPKCGIEKPLAEYSNRGDGKGKAYQCKKCHNAYSNAWQARNREKVNIRAGARKKAIRVEVLAAYGDACQCCGETQLEFLSIDHINNDGAEHRKVVKAANIYEWLRNNNFPKDNFQLLCMNCNFAKGHSSTNECPHVVARKVGAN